MADEQALQGQSSHLANGGRGRSQLLPYQPHGFTKNVFFQTKFWHRSIEPMAAHKMTPGQSQTLGCNFESWSLKKKENTKKSRIGATAAHPAFFWGM